MIKSKKKLLSTSISIVVLCEEAYLRMLYRHKPTIIHMILMWRGVTAGVSTVGWKVLEVRKGVSVKTWKIMPSHTWLWF